MQTIADKLRSQAASPCLEQGELGSCSKPAPITTGSVQVGARAGSYRPTYKPTPGRWKSIDAGVDTSDDQ
ncbi:hypothetical protein HaLaN_31732, partial [Haematococcus lacustris]